MLDNIERNLLIMDTQIRERFAAGDIDGARTAYHDWQVQARRVPEADRARFLAQVHSGPYHNPDPDQWLRDAQEFGRTSAYHYMDQGPSRLDTVTEDDLATQTPAEDDSLEATAYAEGFMSVGRGGARPGSGRKPMPAEQRKAKHAVSLSPENDIFILSQRQPDETFSAALDRILSTARQHESD